jgi:hypothetical protein
MATVGWRRIMALAETKFRFLFHLSP